MKYAQAFNDTALEMVDDKGNKVSFEYLAPVAEQQAIKTLKKEIDGRGDATASALSLMVQILDNPRFAAYAGKIEMGHKMDPKFKAAIREQEEAHLKPIFFSDLPKKMKDSERAEAWDAFISELRTGGIYGNVKSYSTQYLGYFGKLPCVYDAEGHAQKDKLLAVSALSKLIANAKTDMPSAQSEGIAGALIKLAAELANKTEKTQLGATASAIAALRSMLTTFEKVQQDEAETAQRIHEVTATGDVSKQAQAAVARAKAPAQAKGKSTGAKHQEAATA